MTRVILSCGVVAGPLFLVVVAVQELARDGFDPLRDPLSLLSLGDHGWVQVTNFVVTGLLNLVFAAGARRVGGGKGPLLVAGHGLGLVAAGVFVRDPGSGPSSWHHIAHGIGAVVAFGSLIGACHVFTRRFATHPGWAAYCTATGVLVPALLLVSRFTPWEGAALYAAAVVGWTWAAVLATHLRKVKP